MSNASETQEFDPFAGPVIVATAPSTEPQREIWVACALGEDASLAFNESITIRLHGPLDVGALVAALSDVVNRHEALRTTFSGDGLTLCIGAPSTPPVGQPDFSALGPEAAQAEVVALARREVELAFDLSTGPLFRAHVARLGHDDHAIVFTAHHIVCDGWSTAVVVRDWALLYNARTTGQAAALPPAEPFSHYAKQRLEADPEIRAQHEKYWLNQFTGEIPILDLPSDRPRPPRKTFHASRIDAVIEADLVAGVRKAGAKQRSSLFATLLAAFKTLVFRLTAQEDLIIGIPAAGQATEGHAELVGHCVNMLPLRSTIRADEPFSALLARVRKTLLDAQERQDFTFGTLLTKLPLARDPSRLPLVSVIFNVDRGMTSEAIGFNQINAELKANARSYENFDLFLNAVEIGGRVELECQYNTDLYDAATIQRWLASYRLLLSELVTGMESEVGALGVVSEAERMTLSAWNANDAQFERDACVHELFEARAQQNPGAVAFEFQGSSLTFGELDAQSNRLASRLRELGAGRGRLVGICLERGLDLIVGLVATLKSGAGYVPLDPAYPAERLAFMVEDSDMAVLLTTSELERELKFQVSQVFCVDREREALAAHSADRLPKAEASAEPNSVAYVIYTSGSTGKPKGVLVPHRAVVNLLNSVSKRPGLTASDVVLGITTMSFDIAVSETWLPLVVGAKIVHVSRETASDGALLREVCERSNVTFIDATPATYRLLLAAGWQGNDKLTLICTGEAMPKDLALELPRHGKAVWNGYGPTETTVWSTFWQVPPDTTRVLIGTPVDNTRIYILDARKQPVPIGVSGELYIAGDGVTLGYLKRPDLTQDRFLSDPFGPPESRMYRTGDVGRYLNNGDIECLGRNDNQVKLRGFRIELGEIENGLTRHPGVAEAAVILREDRPGDARLVGYVVHRAGSSPDNAELRAELQKTLPDYMVPALYVVLPRMPLTPSGKIDRRALPMPDAAQQTSSSAFVEPRNDLEKLIAELWASALNVGRVSIHDDFFALGGHSLLASQVLARLRRDHGIELSFRKFFEAPTVARLAELVQGRSPSEPAKARSIQGLATGTEFQLSLAQERLRLLEEMHPNRRLVYHLPAAWRLHGPVDLVLLQRSVNEVAKRHEMLRTTIHTSGNHGTQRIADHVELPIALVDLRDVPASARQEALSGRCRDLAAQPFDLQKGPLFRSALFRLDEAEYVYFTVRHNIIWDGWSFDIFVNELTACYGALQRGEPIDLPELPARYVDYVVWQQEWVKGPELAAQVAYWQKQLEGADTDLWLPQDRPRPSSPSYAGANKALTLTRAEADGLTRVAHAAGTTVFNLLFAAYSVVLHRYSGQREILVGTPVRARTLPEVEGIIGPFINAVVLRTHVDPEEPFSSYLGRVKETTLDALSNQEMPLELLGTRPPIVRAFFSYQDARSRPLMLGSTTLTQFPAEPPAAGVDLMLWFMERQSELVVVANFSTELFDVNTIESLLHCFLTLLRDVAEHPERPVGSLALLTAEQRKAAEAPVSEGNAAPAAPAAWAHSALLDRAQSMPQGAAFELEGASLSYGELSQRASALSAGIRRRNPSGGNVAILAANAAELLSALFGCWMSGATALVLDPRDPDAYVKRLLEASAPALTLADESQRSRACLTGLSGVSSIAEASERDAQRPSLDAAPGSQLAWAQLYFGSDGKLVQSGLTHHELGVLVSGLVAQIGPAPRSFVALLDAAGETLPLSALLGVALGAKAFLALEEETLDGTLKRALAESGPVAAFVRASAWTPTLGSAEARDRLTVLAYGQPSAETVTALTRVAQRVLSVYGAPGVLLTRELAAESTGGVLGRPLGSSSLRVVDALGRPLPAGAVGELVAGTLEPAHTGLFGRLTHGGEFQLVGAEGAELVAGRRFEASEVARTLEQHPAVSRAFVRILGYPAATESVVAYFQVKAGVNYTDSELRRLVRSALPAATVPQLLIDVPALPLLANGSVDSDRLPAPFNTDVADDFVAPRTETERAVAELYAEALGVARVGIYDNFFDLGGHSLLCFRVIGRIEEKLGKRLSPRAILLNTLEQVATELAGGAAANTTSSASAPRPAPRNDPSVAGRVLKKFQGFFKR